MPAPFPPPEEALKFLKDRRKLLLFGHVEPDADCLASQLALAGFLGRKGKRVAVFSEGPFDRPEIIPLAGRFRRRIEDADLAGGPAAVVLDCSTADRIGPMAGAIRGLPVLVIDHHASGGRFGDIRWVVPQAPSVTYLIQRLIEEFPDAPLPEEAELLLFGLARDTGFFRHLTAGSGFVFEAASRLVDAGASPREIYRRIHSGWELEKARLLARSIERVESVMGGKVLLTRQSAAQLRRAGLAAARGSDELFRILQAVQGVEVIAFIQEQRPGRCSVGLRSNGRCDVGKLAASMGGGGHTLAAGYTTSGSLTAVRERLLAALKTLVEE
jgi:phosphoesterase RecJ-like protein